MSNDPAVIPLDPLPTGGTAATAVEFPLPPGRLATTEHLTGGEPMPRRVPGAAPAPTGQRPLLVDLGEAAGARSTDPLLVCIPLAGGEAAGYTPLARNLDAHGVPIRVFGVAPPGRTRRDPRPPLTLDRLVRQLADEVAERAADAPVLVLGHCAGAPAALHLTRALEARNVPVDRLIIVANLLRPADPAGHTADDVARMSQAAILGRLEADTGPAGVAHLGPRARAEFAEAFRYDTAQATYALHRALAAVAGHRVAAPATIVLARDDTQMAGYPAAVGNWDLFVSQRRLVVAEHGGHYLHLTRTSLLAEAIERDLAALRPVPDGQFG